MKDFSTSKGVMPRFLDVLLEKHRPRDEAADRREENHARKPEVEEDRDDAETRGTRQEVVPLSA